jgi:PAS domain S-box-containing protein
MSNSHSKKVILLVEDEALIAMNEKMELEKRDYVVHYVTTGEKAVQAILDNVLPIDLILMDINLGSGIDGTQAAEEILKAKDIPVVFLSSHTEPEVVEKTEKITSYGYVVKNSGIIVLDTSIKMAFKLFNAKIAHKQKEEDLRKSEYKYRMLFENMNVAFGLHEAIYDDNGNPVDYRFLDMNPMFLNNLGCTASAIRGHTAKELFPNTEQYWIDTFGKVAKTGESVAFQNYSRELDQWFNTFIFSPQKNQFASFFIDITEQKRAEEKYRLLFNYSNDAIFVHELGEDNLPGSIIEVNDQAYRLLDYKKDELLNLSVLDIAPKKNYSLMFTQIKELIEKKHLTFESEQLRSDGKIVPVEVSAHSYRKGGKDFVVSSVRDISERKKTEQALQESEEKYYSLFNQAVEGIYLHDLEGNIIDANKVACEQTGYSKSELLRLSVFDMHVTGKDTINMSKAETKRIWERSKVGERYSFELEHKRKDGKIFPVSLSTGAIRYGNGKVIMAIVEDITERKQTEEALKREDVFLSSVLDNMKEAIIICNEKGEIIRFNEAARSLHNLPEKQISPEQWAKYYDLYYPDGYTLLATEDIPLFRALQGEDVVNVEIMVAPKDSRYHYLLSCNGRQLIDTEGDITGAVIAMFDITDRKQKEDNLKKAAEEKDFLMKELNHRVKNNLNMVSSLIKLKDSALGAEVDLSDLDNRINAIRLVHEKLYQTEDISHINLQEYIHELNENVFSLSKRHVEIEEHIDDISLSTKTAIPLGLIINELATNAMKHGFAGGGEAVFSVDLTEDKNKNQYILKIFNTGKPFPKDVTLDNPGTLGLQLLSALVSQLQGTIELKQDPRPVFTITFPVDDALAAYLEKK